MPTTFGRLHIAPYMGAFLDRYPDIELDVQLTDTFVDIIREGFDLAIRIGELEDSSLVARKLAPDARVICASPAYLKKHGTPASLADLDLHNCLSAGAQDVWRLEGPEGQCHVRTNGNIRSDSGEFIHEALRAGLGLGLRSTWDIGAALKSGELQIVLPNYRGSSSVAIYAVYPCREFMPAKVNVLIEFLADLYSPVPYWERDLDLEKLPPARTAPKAAGRGAGKGSKAVVGAR
jgi:DNA-binding transcriptional LysR family regulator